MYLFTNRVLILYLQYLHINEMRKWIFLSKIFWQYCVHSRGHIQRTKVTHKTQKNINFIAFYKELQRIYDNLNI